MKTVVLDTNVIISALLYPKGESAKILNIASNGGFKLISSPRLINELERVVHCEKIDRILKKEGLTKEIITSVVDKFKRMCELTFGNPLDTPACRDPDDDWVLACAKEGNAEIIVSGDKDLLILKRYKGIRIVSPEEFFNELEGNQ